MLIQNINKYYNSIYTKCWKNILIFRMLQRRNLSCSFGLT